MNSANFPDTVSYQGLVRCRGSPPPFETITATMAAPMRGDQVVENRGQLVVAGAHRIVGYEQGCRGAGNIRLGMYTTTARVGTVPRSPVSG